MLYAAYDIATSLAAPLGMAWVLGQPSRRPLMARFHPPVPQLPDAPLWFQACSVGEVAVAGPLLTAASTRFPDIPLLLTASTVTGQERARALKPGVHVTWFPFDQRRIVKGFYNRVRPRMLVLVETEIWPNVIRAATRRNIPVVIVNARISDRHYPRYLRYRQLLGPVFGQLAAAGAQNGTYAERLVSLGMESTRVRVTGNTKFDGLTTEIDTETQAKLREDAGIGLDCPVVVFGSTRPGDEALAAACWRRLRRDYPDATLIVAPRHVERAKEIRGLFNEPVRFRSQEKAGGAKDEARVLVVDTLGELIAFYSIARVAVVGGSFYAGVNGHNPLEPAALGVPTVFGPYMSNFTDPAKALVESGGALQVPGADNLYDALRRLLADEKAGREMASKARQAIAANRGATERTMDMLAETMLKYRS